MLSLNFNFAKLFCFCAALFWLSVATAPLTAQEVRQEDLLLARLAIAEEEQRINALISLAALAKTQEQLPDAVFAAVSKVLLNDQTPLVRTHAARVFEFTTDPRVSTPLLTALKQERQLATRKAIIYALARHPAPAVAAALLPLLKDKRRELRATTASALADLADPAATEALLQFLQTRRKDEDAFARSEAARALGRLGSPTAIPALNTALTSDKSQEVRREAARALGRLATKQEAQVLANLQAAAASDDPYLRQAAGLALAQINERQQ